TGPTIGLLPSNPIARTRMTIAHLLRSTLLAGAISAAAFAQANAPSVRIVLPERTRLLQGQLIDIVLEVRNASSLSNLKVTAGDADWTKNFSTAVKAELDCDTTPDMVTRANLQSFPVAGEIKLDVSLTADGKEVKDSRTVLVRPFNITLAPRNIILFIG